MATTPASWPRLLPHMETERAPKKGRVGVGTTPTAAGARSHGHPAPPQNAQDSCPLFGLMNVRVSEGIPTHRGPARPGGTEPAR